MPTWAQERSNIANRAECSWKRQFWVSNFLRPHEFHMKVSFSETISFWPLLVFSSRVNFGPFFSHCSLELDIIHIELDWSRSLSSISSSTKSLVDAFVGGSILNMSSRDAIRIIEEMVMNSYQWPMDRQVMRRLNQVEGIDSITNVFEAKIGNLYNIFPNAPNRRRRTECFSGATTGGSELRWGNSLVPYGQNQLIWSILLAKSKKL